VNLWLEQKNVYHCPCTGVENCDDWWSANNNCDGPPCSLPHRPPRISESCLSQPAWTTTTKRREEQRREHNLIIVRSGTFDTPLITAQRVCIARTMPWQDVRLSVTRRQTGICKRLHILSKFFYHPVVPPF